MSKKDWAADERKLQPVYDDIQSSKHKLALSQVDRFLKKQPRSQPALLLRAFLLNKLGQPDEEVLKAWKGIEATGELTPRGMWFAGLLMRNIGRIDILVALYSKHWEAKPDSAELGQQVVLLATSNWDTPTMCSASRKMFNLLKTMTWARIAAWAEWVDKSNTAILPAGAVFAPPAPENSLRIATTLLSTTRKKIISSEVLWLHVQILLGAGQEAAALALVREEGVDKGGVARNWWRLKTVQEVLRRRSEKGEEGREGVEGLVKEEMEGFAKLLKESPDMQRNWANYDHILQLISAHPTSAHIASAGTLFTDLHASIGAKERAPALALLHLGNVAQDGRMSDEEYKEAVERYWRKWGNKGVIIGDLQGAWKGREAVLASPLQAWSEEEHTDLASYMSGKHARLLLFRLKAKGWEATEDEFKWTWSYYLAGWKHGADLPDTDIRPADEIGLAAVQILLHLWRTPAEGEENRETYLYRAIICLRKICEDSPASVAARYLLIRLYRLAGAPSLAAQPLEQTKLAEVQLDTLLHIYTERSSVDVFLGQSLAVFDSFKDRAEYMYRKTSLDLPQYVQQALENESYSQITSIRQLHHSLATSLPAAMLAIESTRIGLLQRIVSSSPGSLVSAELTRARDADEWVDNRDWELVPTLVGDREMKHVLGLGVSGGAGWVRRWREVLACVEAVQAGKGVESLTSDDSLTDEVSLAERAAPDSLTRVLRATQAALQPAVGDSNGTQEVDDLANVSDALVQFAKADAGSRWDKLQNAILLIEFSRVVDIVSTRVAETIKPKGKNKKTSPSPTLKDFATTIQGVQARLKVGRDEVVATFHGLPEADETVDVVELMSGSGIEEEFVGKVWKEVIESRKIAVDNLRSLLLEI